MHVEQVEHHHAFPGGRHPSIHSRVRRTPYDVRRMPPGYWMSRLDVGIGCGYWMRLLDVANAYGWRMQTLVVIIARGHWTSSLDGVTGWCLHNAQSCQWKATSPHHMMNHDRRARSRHGSHPHALSRFPANPDCRVALVYWRWALRGFRTRSAGLSRQRPRRQPSP